MSRCTVSELSEEEGRLLSPKKKSPKHGAAGSATFFHPRHIGTVGSPTGSTWLCVSDIGLEQQLAALGTPSIQRKAALHLLPT